MPTVKAANLRKGVYFLYKNEPYLVLKTEFVGPGKGAAFVKAKIKGLISQTTQNLSFRSTESFEELDVETRLMQFLYKDADEAVFMDPQTYEQVNIPLSLVEDTVGYFTAELEMYILFFNDKAIGVRVPPKVTLEVTYAEDAVAGNRVNAPKKPVTVETGIEVQVPLFITVGDSIIVDTETGAYVARATK